MTHDSDAVNIDSFKRRDMLLQEAAAIIDAGTEAGVTVRLVGSLGIQEACPKYRDLAVKNRTIKDIDMAGRKADFSGIREVLVELGFVENREIFVSSEGKRSIFKHMEREIDLDLFYGTLEFCHTIDIGDRLQQNRRTIPPAELLLQKLQIVEINHNDLVDLSILLLEHKLTVDDDLGINRNLIASIWGQDWGFWRTSKGNLDRLWSFIKDKDSLSDEHVNQISNMIGYLKTCLNECPKSLSWKVRNRIGDRVKWYNDVEDV